MWWSGNGVVVRWPARRREAEWDVGAKCGVARGVSAPSFSARADSKSRRVRRHLTASKPWRSYRSRASVHIAVARAWVGASRLRDQEMALARDLAARARFLHIESALHVAGLRSRPGFSASSQKLSIAALSQPVVVPDSHRLHQFRRPSFAHTASCVRPSSRIAWSSDWTPFTHSSQHSSASSIPASPDQYPH